MAFLILLFLPCACTSLPEIGPGSLRQTQEIERQIAALDSSVDREEANRLAALSVEKAIALAHQYQVVRPAWFHNVLVNHQVRERGLCFEWANDLFLTLHELPLQSIDLHLIVAKMDTRHEHNAIAVTPLGASITNGVVLDAWRHSGRLWCGPVSSDKYPWRLLPKDRFNPKIKQALERSAETSAGSSE